MSTKTTETKKMVGRVLHTQKSGGSVYACVPKSWINTAFIVEEDAHNSNVLVLRKVNIIRSDNGVSV